MESYAAPKLCLINLVDSEGDTPMHTAVRSSDLDGIKTCLWHGASILVVQNERETPVHYACSKRDLEAVRIMLDACPSEIKLVMTMTNGSGYTPRHLATLYDNVPLVDYMVMNGAFLEQTEATGLAALLLGTTKGSSYTCRRLIDHGANMLAKDTNERNIWHLIILRATSNMRPILLPSLIDQLNFNATPNSTHTNYPQRLSVSKIPTERGQYNYLDVSLFKALMMMFGEYEHSNSLIHPLLTDPKPDRQNTVAIFVFYIAFLLFMPIIVMNLLIGLAVGDIEEVRRKACQQLLIQQIFWLADLESKFPKFIQTRLVGTKAAQIVQQSPVSLFMFSLA
ncbi:Transient receptor potential cation channel subfamily A member 1 [Fasciola hepatica]|uniref:Transient receptor potential cation channel subfamily A member 1 n=1 Tax=Fasciola hepatica TaxID=6192 RepID=A0A4E0S0W8_FASHE|nr:Transient receptor potential cation channel subfamily A member 1 [Fasciola hepatica]